MTRSASRSALRNSLTHFLAVGVNVATGFAVMPAVVHGIGIEAFGIWAIANTMIGYAGVLDLGLGQTLVKKTSEYVAKGETGKLNGLVGVALTIYLIAAVVVFAAFAVVAAYGSSIFHVPPALASTLRNVILLLGAVAAVGFPMSALAGIIGGLHDFHVGNIVGSALNVVKLVGTFALVDAGYGLMALVALGAGLSMAGWICNYLWVRHRLPALRLLPGAPRGSALRDTLRFSGSMFIWSMAGQALQSMDRIIVGLVLPVRFAGIYEIGARLNAYSRYAINVAFVAMPAASALHAEGRHDELRRLFLQGTRLLVGVYGLVATVILVLGHEFVRLWVGAGFDASVEVAQILVLASLFQSQNSLGHVVLVGAGRLRAFTIVMALYPVVIATCALAALPAGLAGIASGVLVAVVVLESALLLTVLGAMDIGIGRFVTAVHLRTAPAIIGSAAAAFAMKERRPEAGWLDFGADAAVLVLAYGVLVAILGMSKGERELVWLRLSRAIAYAK